MNRPPPILCLDFDGVIHSYTSGWMGAVTISDPPVPGAIDFIKEAVNHFQVHIFSSRSHQAGGIRAMMHYLLRHGIDPGWFDVSELQLEGFSVLEDGDVSSAPVWTDAEGRTHLNPICFPLEKPSAMVTIDDRALTFTGLWPTMDQLRGFKPWNKVGATPSGEALSAKCDDNAQLWAQAFCTAFPYAGVDESLMTVWFAAAIERACDVRHKRQDKEPVKIEGGHGGEVRG